METVNIITIISIALLGSFGHCIGMCGGILVAYSTYAQIGIDSSLILYSENIMKITFNNNNRIKSAYYHLEAAKYNFKLFESEYTQFNPLIVAPKINANSNSEYSSDITTGMRKE